MLRLVAKKMQENTRFYINQIKYSEKRILILFSIFIQFSCAFLGTKRREGREKKERKKERKKKYLQGIAHLWRATLGDQWWKQRFCAWWRVIELELWFSFSDSPSLSLKLWNTLSLSLKLWNSMKLSHSSVIYIQKERRKKKAGSCNWMKIKTE